MLGNAEIPGAMPIALFLLVIGGFLGVINATGTLDAGIGH